MKKEEHFFASNVRTLQETAAFGRGSSFKWSRAEMPPAHVALRTAVFFSVFQAHRIGQQRIPNRQRERGDHI
ncbi:hypothetical protein EDM55_08340 [Brevibacillus centrosporus]|nr:hypothetical protein EDM55_08340 [Brevibacillus centrosporus]